MIAIRVLFVFRRLQAIRATTNVLVIQVLLAAKVIRSFPIIFFRSAAEGRRNKKNNKKYSDSRLSKQRKNKNFFDDKGKKITLT